MVAPFDTSSSPNHSVQCGIDKKSNIICAYNNFTMNQFSTLIKKHIVLDTNDVRRGYIKDHIVQSICGHDHDNPTCQACISIKSCCVLTTLVNSINGDSKK